MSRRGKYALLLALWIVLAAVPVGAQGTPSDEGWEVIERCVGELPAPVPQSEWDFEGVIFSEDQDGVHAIRSDMTPYFIAFDNGETSFPGVGAFSPDGRWFAYPVGSTVYWVSNMGTNQYNVEALLAVSTGPDQQVYRVPWQYYSFQSFHGYAAALPIPNWLDNERFIYPNFSIYRDEWGIINPFSGETHLCSDSGTEANLCNSSDWSPDLTRGLRRADDASVHMYDIENDLFLGPELWAIFDVVWLPDSSGLITEIQSGNVLAILDRDGEPTETISTVGYFSRNEVSPDGRWLVFITRETEAWDSPWQLLVADIQNRVVVDLCAEVRGEDFSIFPINNLAWSPDSTVLAFAHDGYPVLLNVETMQTQILDYPTGQILGWYPLE